MSNMGLLPFIKWPGGKRWLMSRYSQLFPQSYQRFFEPFLGGAAAFFHIAPEEAILSDINKDLIVLYNVMRDNHPALASAMKTHQSLHSEEYFYSIRKSYSDDPIQSASRFLYLNRMCYNGMYRVNKLGQFNVPIGTKQNCIYDIDLFPEYSKRLKSARIISSDFAEVVRNSRENDFIFADPPYTISHNQNSFIKYNEQLFTWKDQERLMESLCAARSRGTCIIATNANFMPLKKMYSEQGFYVKVLERFSVMSGRVDKRQKQEELLISTRPLD